tara:strand:- start:386 stop:583 length:198 start_codon:yes stop_codon:yes gene_type:complete
MKNNNTVIIISISIIIGSLIIAYSIMNKPMSSYDDCYNKVYKQYMDGGRYSEGQSAIFARQDCEG